MAKANQQKEVDLKLVRPSSAALRKIIDKKEPSWLEFVDTIRNKGILQPVLVREQKDPDTGETFYQLIDGLHRWHGATDAGLETIPVYITVANDVEALEDQIINNMHRFETRAADYAKGLKRLLSFNPTWTALEIGNKLGKSVTTINNLLGLTNLTEPIQELVNNEDINLTNAQVLSKLPQPEQAEFLDRAISMTPDQFGSLVTNRLKDIRDAKRQGKPPGPAQFKPNPYLQTSATIRDEMDNLQIGKSMIHEFGITAPEDAWKLAVQWVLHMDPKSVEVEKLKDDERKKKAEAAKLVKKAEKEEKKAKEAAILAAAAV